MSSVARRLVATLALASVVLVACSSDPPSRHTGLPTGDSPSSSTSPTTTAIATTTSAARTTIEVEPFSGRPVPVVPESAEQAAAMLVEVETRIRDDGLDAMDYADLGHQEQILVRTLARNRTWVPDVLASLPGDLAKAIELHLEARSQLGALHTAPPLDTLPAWEIIPPLPLDDLRAHYEQASVDTGIDWRVLAAINLIETGMGRIDGLSSAGAQGPMQFLPSTWEEVSDGGDIDDPGDAIAGAARYLVRRGALDDIRAGLWGYNNSDNYVNAVLTYVELLELDDRALRGIYNWEIYVGTDVGTLWLPVGLITDGTQPAADYLAENPWSRF